MRTISTDELKEWIQNWFETNRYYHPYSKQNNIPIPELYDILERIPTIEPERKTGRWGEIPRYKLDTQPNLKCPFCGNEVDWYGCTKYCGECGARLELNL